MKDREIKTGWLNEDYGSKSWGIRLKIASITAFAIAAVVLSMNLTAPDVLGKAETPVEVDSGAVLFENNCARCHGSDGTGGKGPNLASEKRQAKWRDSDEKLIKKIEKGGLFMPSFGKKLKPEEIKAIADHVRTLKE